MEFERQEAMNGRFQQLDERQPLDPVRLTTALVVLVLTAASWLGIAYVCLVALEVLGVGSGLPLP